MEIAGLLPDISGIVPAGAHGDGIEHHALMVLFEVLGSIDVAGPVGDFLRLCHKTPFLFNLIDMVSRGNLGAMWPSGAAREPQDRGRKKQAGLYKLRWPAANGRKEEYLRRTGDF